MQRTPASAWRPCGSRLALAAAAVWSVAVAAGFAVLWKYKTTPGYEEIATPIEWPGDGALARPAAVQGRDHACARPRRRQLRPRAHRFAADHRRGRPRRRARVRLRAEGRRAASPGPDRGTDRKPRRAEMSVAIKALEMTRA